MDPVHTTSLDDVDTSAQQERFGLLTTRMPLVLAAIVGVLSLAVNFWLWNSSRQQMEQNLQTEFDYQARRTMRRIEQRMATYEQMARGTEAFLLGSMDVRRDDFRLFVRSLRLPEKFPGIQGLALARVVPHSMLAAHVAAVRREGFPDYAVRPVGKRDVYSSITNIEPFTGLNPRAFGFDMLTEPVRRAAMERARDTGQAAASGKIKLIQENGIQEQAGLVMYLPVYARGKPTATLAERRANLIGWVGAPFRMNDLMAGLGGERSSDIFLAIYDGDTLSSDALLYDSAREEASQVSSPRDAHFNAVQRITVAGRPWLLDLRSNHSFEARLDTGKPRFIAIAGTVASLLLAFLVWTLASGRRRAVLIAAAMTRQLRASNARLGAEQRRVKVILENSHDAFVAVDPQGRVTDWNARAEKMFGWSTAEAVGKGLDELIVPAEMRSRHNEGFRRFAATGEAKLIAKVVEMNALHQSGRIIPVELAVAGFPEPSGHAASAFIRDLSERRETQRREAERLQALDEARTALQHAQKLEAVGKLTGGVAHDFNNVLQVIGSNVELLQYQFAGNEILDKRLAGVLAAVERGSKLSSQLLAFARRQPLQPVTLNLGQVVGNMQELLQRALGETIRLEIRVAPGLWSTFVDPGQLENVILNLTINARDAMPDGGQLVLAMSNTTADEHHAEPPPPAAAGDYVRLAVSDTGVGMTPEVVEQAFEPFFTTKPQGQGTGLGLSMAYGFVKQSGGHIWIRSTPGRGTTIDIYLPRSLQPDATPLSQPGETIVGGRETILVVEDDSAVQAAVVGMLEELGYRVLTANDGESALAVMRAGSRIDLVFTDVVMPGPVSSPQLADYARRRPHGAAVLFTSGYTRNALVSGGRLAEGVQLLSKPYRREQLAAKIREVLARHAAERAAFTKQAADEDETRP